jgi:hypothetical protein
MPITFGCACGKRYQVKDDLAGKSTTCPACGAVLRAPDLASSSTKPVNPPSPTIATKRPAQQKISPIARSIPRGAIAKSPAQMAAAFGTAAKDPPGLAFMLRDSAKWATGVLFTLGIFGVVVNLFTILTADSDYLVQLQRFMDASPYFRPLSYVGAALGPVYIALGIWAMSNPLPPAIIGFVLQQTAAIANSIMTLQVIANRNGMAAICSLSCMLVVEALFVLVFVKAIKGGIKHRRLRKMRTG